MGESMTAYYNEIDKFAAAWLRELIKAGHIAPGYVDERSIEDVTANDLKGFTQCHFFAGIGVWSYALRKAGWPDNRPVWTGSCPCQPFSEAGKRAGFTDQRHLWPAWHHLIKQHKPAAVFGEQVASKDGLAWLDLVQTDMEATGYAFAPFDLCAAGFGAPHIRQRLFFIADSMANTSGKRSPEFGRGWQQSERSTKDGAPCILGNSSLQRLQSCKSETLLPAWRREEGRAAAEYGLSPVVGMAESENCRSEKRKEGSGWKAGNECLRPAQGSGGPSKINGFWSTADWLLCRDGKWRAVESGTFPLVNGATARVGRLRGYGNAIVAEQAKEFVKAYIGVSA